MTGIPAVDLARWGELLHESHGAVVELVGPHGYIHGWIKVGAPDVSAASAAARSYIGSMRGKISPVHLDNYNIAGYEHGTLDKAFTYSPGQEAAIRDYTGGAYGDINESARSGGTAGPVADALSSAMQPLPDDLVLLRQVSGQHALDDVAPGDVIKDDGFSSTTLLGRGRFASGQGDTTVMHIMTPAGTRAVWTDGVSQFPEDEVILDRGQHLVVMKREQRPGRSDITDVYLLAIPDRSAA